MTGTNTTQLIFRWEDENGTVLDNVTVNYSITSDYADSVYRAWSNETNSSGYSILNFNPDCGPKYYEGVRKWKAEIVDNSLYKDNSTAT